MSSLRFRSVTLVDNCIEVFAYLHPRYEHHHQWIEQVLNDLNIESHEIEQGGDYSIARFKFGQSTVLLHVNDNTQSIWFELSAGSSDQKLDLLEKISNSALLAKKA